MLIFLTASHALHIFSRVNRFPELSRTSSLFPGLSSPGKCHNKIPGLSRFPRTRTNPVSKSSPVLEKLFPDFFENGAWETEKGLGQRVSAKEIGTQYMQIMSLTRRSCQMEIVLVVENYCWRYLKFRLACWYNLSFF